jgi:hypothetical protein
MQSDAHSDMGINKLVESFSIDLMDRGRLGWIRQVMVWGGILLLVALVQEYVLTNYYLLLRVWLITIPQDHLKVVLKVHGRLCSIPDSKFGHTSSFSMAMAEAQLRQLVARYHFSWVILVVLRGIVLIWMRISFLQHLGH